MSAILLEDAIVHYEVLGRGRPVIFLHGWVGSWRYWIPMMQAVSLNYRAYALDLWGFGDTAKNRRYRLDDQVELLVAFMEKIGILKIALIGHGLGALVGMRFAARYPEAVDRLMAVSLPLGREQVSHRLRNTSPDDLAHWLLSGSPLTEPVLTDAIKTDPQAVLTSLDDLGELNLVGLWQGFHLPCLLVYGLDDPLIEPASNEQVVTMPESMHLVYFENAGHFPMLDDSSKFNRLTNDFLALPSGESPRQLQLKEEWKRRVR